jgi:hypothetical protein
MGKDAFSIHLSWVDITELKELIETNEKIFEHANRYMLATCNWVRRRGGMGGHAAHMAARSPSSRHGLYFVWREWHAAREVAFHHTWYLLQPHVYSEPGGRRDGGQCQRRAYLWLRKGVLSLQHEQLATAYRLL